MASVCASANVILLSIDHQLRLMWGENNNTHFANALLTSRLISGGLWDPVGKFLLASHSGKTVSPMCVNTPLARHRKSTATFN